MYRIKRQTVFLYFIVQRERNACQYQPLNANRVNANRVYNNDKELSNYIS
jgi:hypothetical protein